MIKILLCLVSAILIIWADSIIKIQASSNLSLKQGITSKLMLWCYVLYFIQILVAWWLFRLKAELSIYTIMFVIFYSLLGVGLGIMWFGEVLTTMQYIGIFLALISFVFINWK